MKVILRFVAIGVFFFAYAVGPDGVQAQADGATYEGGAQLNAIWAMPQGDFADNVDRMPAGASVLFGGMVPDTPIFLGTELTVLGYGTEQFLEIPRYEDVPVQSMVVSNKQSMVMGHLVARLHFPVGAVRPYVDALAGMRSFVSTVQVESDPLIFPTGFSSRAKTTDWGFSYGGGAGVDVVLYEGATDLMRRPMRVSMNIGARFLF